MAKEIYELSMDRLAAVNGGATDGISLLVAATQMKASNANDDAMAGAQLQSLYVGCPNGHFWR